MKNVLQKRKIEFKVENSGTVPLEIKWYFCDHERKQNRSLSAKEKKDKRERVKDGKDKIIYILNLTFIPCFRFKNINQCNFFNQHRLSQLLH